MKNKVRHVSSKAAGEAPAIGEVEPDVGPEEDPIDDLIPSLLERLSRLEDECSSDSSSSSGTSSSSSSNHDGSQPLVPANADDGGAEEVGPAAMRAGPHEPRQGREQR